MPATVDIFRRHLHRIFIETGTHDGSALWTALEAGYKEVYSIEAGQDLYEQCLAKFANEPRVHLILGRSEIELGKLLDRIHEPATVWLDAHSSFGAMLPGTNLAPLREELCALTTAPVREHTVLVDDVRLFPDLGTSLEEIKSLLLRVNPAYTLDLIDGNYFKSDVLVASLRSGQDVLS